MRWLEAQARTRRGAGLVFALGLAVYGLQSLALPLFPGRDLATYLRYYDQFLHGTALPMAMLYRTPGASLVVGGALDLLGGSLTQVLMALLYAASITAWSAAAAVFSRRAAVLTASALLVYPSYGYVFHALSSDAICAAAVSAWALLLVRVSVRPTARGFALVGLGIGVLALVRPGNQFLLVLALLPLVLNGRRRDRLARAAALAAAGVLVLGLWAVHNGLRYGDYEVARGTYAFFPFYRVLTTDHLVAPENGPASRELARVVERDLLTREPYRSYDVGLRDFFAKADPRMHEDLVNLSDRVWGWDTRYAALRRVGIEAVRAHPRAYAEGVARTVWLEIWGTAVYVPSRGELGAGAGGPADTVQTASGALPRPSEGSLIPAANTGFYSTTRDGHIREVWTSPTEHRVVIGSPAGQSRLESTAANTAHLSSLVPTYAASATLAHGFNLLSRAYPRPVLWLLVGLAAVLVRRPRRAGIALVLAFSGLLVIACSALGIYAILEFALPFTPSFVLLAAVGLLGERTSRRANAGSS